MPQDHINVTHNIRPQRLLEALDRLKVPTVSSPVLLDLKYVTILDQGDSTLRLQEVTQGERKTFGQKEASVKLLVSRMNVSEHTKAHITTRIDQMKTSPFTLTALSGLLSEAIREDKTTNSLLKSRGIEPETVPLELVRIMEDLDDKDTARNAIADAINAIRNDVQASSWSQEGLAKVMRAAMAPASSKERLTDKQLTNLARVYVRNDGIRGELIEIINNAKHPAAVVDAAFVLTGNNFWLQQHFKPNSNLVTEYSTNMLRMVDEAGGDSAGRLKGFIEKKLLLQNGDSFGNKFNALSTRPTENPKQPETSDERRTRAVNYVSQALLSLTKEAPGLNITKGKEALDEVMFRPRFNNMPATNGTVKLATSSIALAAQMKKTIDYFDATDGEGEKRQQKIRDIGVPQDATAQYLIKMSVGKTNSNSVTRTETQRAILNAMLTNIRQGNGPTCTATSHLILLARTDPTAILDKLIDIATDGLMKNVDDTLPPVHAVRNVVNDGDPLVRSLEATIMVGVARDSRSQMSTDVTLVGHFAAGLFYPYSSSKKTSKPPQYQPIVDVVSAKFDLTYDPTAYIEKDGIRKNGAYILCKKGTDPREKIQSRDEFIAALQDAVLDTEIQERLPLEYIGVEGFKKRIAETDAYMTSFDELLPDMLKTAGGGQTEDVATFLTNTKMQKDVLIAKDEDKTMKSEDWRDQKMPLMLASLIMRATQSGQNAGVFSSPKHALTFDVDHPTLSRVDRSTVDACETSIRNILLDPPLTPADGAELADVFAAKMKAEDPTFMLSPADRNFCESGVSLRDALASLEAALPTVTQDALSILSSKRTGGVMITMVPTNVKKSFSTLKTEYMDRFRDGNELVFADPNYGSESSELVWVLRRNPTTQGIDIYEKSLDGSLAPLTDETCRNGEWSTLRPMETKK